MERRDASAAGAVDGTVIRGTVRRGVRLTAALAAAGLALTGCGAGQNAQTSEMGSAISGVDVDAGSLALRNLQVDFGETGSYPEGGRAPLRVWIGNQGTEPVVLEAVTSPAAEAVTLATEFVIPEEVEETPDDESPTPGPDESETPGGNASETPDSDDATPTADAAESPEGEGAEVVAEPVGELEITVEIVPSSYVYLAPSHGSFLLLEGLKEDVSAGSMIEVVFVFSNGEKVAADLPVGVPQESESRSYFGDPHDEAAE